MYYRISKVSHPDPNFQSYFIIETKTCDMDVWHQSECFSKWYDTIEEAEARYNQIKEMMAYDDAKVIEPIKTLE